MMFSRFAETILLNFRLCLLEISTSAGRTIITTFGLFLGVVSLLVNLAFVRGMDNDLSAGMQQIGGLNIITIQHIKPQSIVARQLSQRSPGLSFSSVEKAVEGIPYVKAIIRSESLRWQSVAGQGKSMEGFIIAVDPTYFNTFNYKVKRGRFLNNEDLQKKSQVCIIGNRLAKKLFPGTDPIGNRITIRSVTFTIVGIVGSGSIRSRRDSECCIPYSVFTSKFQKADHNLKSVSVVLTSSDFYKQAKVELSNRLTKQHRGVIDFEVITNDEKIKDMRAASTAMKLIFFTIALISSLVGGISIMNIMFATIGERVREIGIRKALGARKKDILIQFIIEAIIVSIVGGIPGIMLGASILLIPPGIFPYVPQLTQCDFLMSFGFTLAAGLLSGLFPALRAANMQPIDALRS